MKAYYFYELYFPVIIGVTHFIFAWRKLRTFAKWINFLLLNMILQVFYVTILYYLYKNNIVDSGYAVMTVSSNIIILTGILLCVKAVALVGRNVSPTPP